jgi:hypothetical protein
MKGYFASFEEPDQKHTGNAEDAGGGLSGELAVSRDNRDRLARLQVVENDEKQVVKRLGDGDLPAVRADQFGVSGLD